MNYTLQEWQLLITSHDGLIAFKRVAGAPGTQKVPDLAQEIPKPTNGGKTWTFKLRSGIKFSDGSTLDGADVKAKDIYGWTVLRRAAEKGHEVMVRQLVEHGADVNAKDDDGRIVLRWAAENGREAAVC